MKENNLSLLFVIPRAPLPTPADFFFVFAVSHQGCDFMSLWYLTSCRGCFVSPF